MPCRVLGGIGGQQLLRMLGGDLHGQPLIPGVEGRDRLGRDQLKDDGIARVGPTPEGAEDQHHRGIEKKNILPQRLAELVGEVEGDEIGAAGRGAHLEGNDDADAVQKATEGDIEQHILHQRLKLEQLEKEGCTAELDTAEQGETRADAACTEQRDRDIQ